MLQETISLLITCFFISRVFTSIMEHSYKNCFTGFGNNPNSASLFQRSRLWWGQGRNRTSPHSGAHRGPFLCPLVLGQGFSLRVLAAKLSMQFCLGAILRSELENHETHPLSGSHSKPGSPPWGPAKPHLSAPSGISGCWP